MAAGACDACWLVGGNDLLDDGAGVLICAAARCNDDVVEDVSLVVTFLDDGASGGGADV